MITYEVRVCIGRDDPDKHITVKCHDTGVDLQVYLETYRPDRTRNVTQPYRIPVGSTAVIKIAKPDKTRYVSEGKFRNGGIFFPLNPQAFTVAGVSHAEVSIYGADSRRLTSATFDIEVPPECVCECEEGSEDFVDIMAEQIKAAIEAEAKATAAAKRAQEAVAHTPILSDEVTWKVWDFERGEYIDTGISAKAPAEAVLFTEQELTEGQAEQARRNIGAEPLYGGLIKKTFSYAVSNLTRTRDIYIEKGDIVGPSETTSDADKVVFGNFMEFGFDSLIDTTVSGYQSTCKVFVDAWKVGFFTPDLIAYADPEKTIKLSFTLNSEELSRYAIERKVDDYFHAIAYYYSNTDTFEKWGTFNRTVHLSSSVADSEPKAYDLKVPVPTTDSQAVPKSYVDENVPYIIEVSYDPNTREWTSKEAYDDLNELLLKHKVLILKRQNGYLPFVGIDGDSDFVFKGVTQYEHDIYTAKLTNGSNIWSFSYEEIASIGAGECIRNRYVFLDDSGKFVMNGLTKVATADTLIDMVWQEHDVWPVISFTGEFVDLGYTSLGIQGTGTYNPSGAPLSKGPYTMLFISRDGPYPSQNNYNLKIRYRIIDNEGSEYYVTFHWYVYSGRAFEGVYFSKTFDANGADAENAILMLAANGFIKPLCDGENIYITNNVVFTI